jgi:hypothetical protein
MGQVTGASAVRGTSDVFELQSVGGKAEQRGVEKRRVEGTEVLSKVGDIITQPPSLRPRSGGGADALASTTRSSEEPTILAESKSQGAAELPERVGYLAEHDLIKRDEKRNILTNDGTLLVRRAGDKISVLGEKGCKDRCAVSIYYAGAVHHHYFIFSDSGEVKRVYPVQATRQDTVVWRASGETHQSVSDLTEEIKRRHEASIAGVMREREDRSAPVGGGSRAIAAQQSGGRSEAALNAIVTGNRVERLVAVNVGMNLFEFKQRRAEGAASKKKRLGLSQQDPTSN